MAPPSPCGQERGAEGAAFAREKSQHRPSDGLSARVATSGIRSDFWRESRRTRCIYLKPPLIYCPTPPTSSAREELLCGKHALPVGPVSAKKGNFREQNPCCPLHLPVGKPAKQDHYLALGQ